MFQEMNSAFDIYRMMATAADAFTRYSWTNPREARSTPVDNSQRVWRLYMAFVNSGYRYLARWAEISAKRYPELARALPALNSGRAVSDHEMAVLIDSFRAYLREMAELPLEESKQLQGEIDAIMHRAEGEAAGKKKAAKKKRPAGLRRARAKS
ncbi:MAG TPA: hypothetical protein VIY49_21405 [Bryobacteraceae bacterium]